MKEKKTSKSDRSKKIFLEALEKTLGVVSAAAKMVNMDRSNHYRWLSEDDLYRKSYEELNDVAIDFAEHSLIKQIKAGNTTATIFYLKTKGKKRGYVERQEIQVDERPIFDGIDLSLGDD